MVKNVILDLNYKNGTSKSKSNMKFCYSENIYIWTSWATKKQVLIVFKMFVFTLKGSSM